MSRAASRERPLRHRLARWLVLAAALLAAGAARAADVAKPPACSSEPCAARYEADCAQGQALACLSAGVLRRRDPDRSRPERLLRKGCDLGQLEACGQLGLLYQGEGTPQGFARAAPFAERACRGGVADGCALAGEALQIGAGGRQDMPGAAARFEQGCRGGSHRACTDLASMLLDGRGVPQDVGRAVKLLTTACDLSAGSDALACSSDCRGYPGACGLLGIQFIAGKTLPQDFAHGFSLLETACARGDPPSCYFVGKLRMAGRNGLARDPARARAAFDRACRGGLRDGCAEREAP